MKKLLLTLIILASSLIAQNTHPYAYIATTGSVAVSAAAYAATLQSPATGSLQVSFPHSPSTGASVQCSVSCTFSIIRDATGATATAGTVNKVTGDAPSPSVTFWTGSNYSGGTTLVTYTIAAGIPFSLDMGQMYLQAGVNSNITIAIASMTGNVVITFYPIEWH